MGLKKSSCFKEAYFTLFLKSSYLTYTVTGAHALGLASAALPGALIGSCIGSGAHMGVPKLQAATNTLY